MKLFQRLLVAPAALGLLAPITANANEVNFNAISNYSDTESVEFANSFDNTFENNDEFEPLIAGGEGMVDDHDGGFSQTTTLTGTVGFLGAAATGGDPVLEGDGAGDDVNLGGTQFTYYVGLDLNTTFTGTDNLNVGLESGNAVNVLGTQTGLVSSILDFGAANGDAIKVHNVHYSSTLGDNLSYIIGDSLDASAAFTGACAYSAFTDALGNCGTGNSAATGSGDDVALSTSYDFGSGVTLGAGIGTTSGALGSFTKETDDRYAVQLAYEADSYGLAATYSSFYDADSVDISYVGLNGFYKFDNTAIESVSVGWESGSPETGTDGTGYFVGLNTTPIGPGTLSLGLGTNSDTQGSTIIPENVEESLIYEAAYSFDINDGLSATIGGFLQERIGTSEDLTGVAMTTTFSF